MTMISNLSNEIKIYKNNQNRVYNIKPVSNKSW